MCRVCAFASVWSDAIKGLKFVLTILFMSHACACVWMMIANLEKGENDT